jgi:hypothetical protein
LPRLGSTARASRAGGRDPRIFATGRAPKYLHPVARVRLIVGLLGWALLAVVVTTANDGRGFPRSSEIRGLEKVFAGTGGDGQLVWSARSTEIAVTFGAANPQEGIDYRVRVSLPERPEMEVGGCAISRSWIASFCVVHGLTDDTTYALDVLQIDSEGRQTPVVEGLVVATSSHSIESAIASPAQAAAERDRLRSVVFGSEEPLEAVETSMTSDICTEDPGFLYCTPDFTAVARIDLLRVEMALGLESLVGVLEPDEPRGAIVYHRGHEGGETPNFRANVLGLLERDYAVAIVSMPLFPPNAPAIVLDGGRFGVLHLNTHDDFAFVEAFDETGPLKLFLQPALAVIDYFADRSGPLGMIGLSGGGWTTTMVAALDPRVEVSVAVAGSVPFAYRMGVTENRGDWEQRLPRVAGSIDYTDLYLLATTDSRTAYVVSHDDDPCCFASAGGSRAWERELSEVASKWGGRLEFPHLAASTHDIQPETLALLLELLG